MTTQEASQILKMLLGYLKGEIEPPSIKTVEEAEKFDQEGYECLNMAIRSLEADRTIEKVLYAIREEMQYIKVAELQIYGKASWRFTNAIEDIINRHLEEVENDR